AFLIEDPLNSLRYSIYHVGKKEEVYGNKPIIQPLGSFGYVMKQILGYIYDCNNPFERITHHNFNFISIYSSIGLTQYNVDIMVELDTFICLGVGEEETQDYFVHSLYIYI
ncbi:hypothetical protein ACJX0J_014519, partial [Zea mays]